MLTDIQEIFEQPDIAAPKKLLLDCIPYSIIDPSVLLIFPEYLLTSEPVKKMNEIYSLFKIKCPTTIEYTPSKDELKRMHAV